MKKLIIGAYLVVTSITVWAACTTHTYIIDGKYVTCTTCCYGSNCTTNCF